MKNLLLIGIVLLVSLNLSAQNILVLNEETVDISGTTVTLDGSTDSEIAFEFELQNVTSADIEAKLELFPIDVIAETTNSFCVVGQCVMPGQTLSPKFTLNANSTTPNFSFHYNANGNEGQSRFRLKIFNTSIESDTVDFTLVINASNSAVENAFGQMLVGDIYPNPASQHANIDYNLPENSTLELMVYDMLGKEVMNFNVQASGTIRMPLGDLERGTYFCRYLINGDLKDTQKLIIK